MCFNNTIGRRLVCPYCTSRIPHFPSLTSPRHVPVTLEPQASSLQFAKTLEPLNSHLLAPVSPPHPSREHQERVSLQHSLHQVAPAWRSGYSQQSGRNTILFFFLRWRIPQKPHTLNAFGARTRPWVCWFSESSMNLHPDLQAQDSNPVFHTMELKTVQLSTCNLRWLQF